ncbi:uncharacterized protein [Nicotiana tomentosiformis]|uniref:uncharacterized protein n=1 Tax=Nicotiana tomentosiformis TaxID=4098 RepID=UPI00388CCF69
MASEEEQKRLERFKKYFPLTFSGVASEDAQSFLDQCHHILCTMGIMELSGVALTTFQLTELVYRWWQVYEESRPAGTVPLTRTQFTDLFLRELVPQTLRDALCTEFEKLHQGTMIVHEYATRFPELSIHASALVSTVRERVNRFIEGLIYDLRFGMARDLETDTLFQ